MTVAERKEYEEYAEKVIDCSKHIWEGWTVQDFIDALEFELDMIMSGRSWKKPFKTRTELKVWCADNQPYYKKAIPEVIEYFSILYGIQGR